MTDTKSENKIDDIVTSAMNKHMEVVQKSVKDHITTVWTEAKASLIRSVEIAINHDPTIFPSTPLNISERQQAICRTQFCNPCGCCGNGMIRLQCTGWIMDEYPIVWWYLSNNNYIVTNYGRIAEWASNCGTAGEIKGSVYPLSIEMICIIQNIISKMSANTISPIMIQHIIEIFKKFHPHLSELHKLTKLRDDANTTIKECEKKTIALAQESKDMDFKRIESNDRIRRFLELESTHKAKLHTTVDKLLEQARLLLDASDLSTIDTSTSKEVLQAVVKDLHGIKAAI